MRLSLDIRFFVSNNMNKKQILEKLKSINYPGFSRDIVSFGMVKDIVIKDNNVSLKINISSQNEKKKQAVINDVKKELDSH